MSASEYSGRLVHLAELSYLTYWPSPDRRIRVVRLFSSDVAAIETRV